MTRNLSIVVVFAAALALASGTRQPLQAASTPSADVVFLIEAAQASFTNATTLALNGLTGSAQSYGAGAKTGIYPIQNFTDGSASSQYVDTNGQWLSNPQAVMYGVGQDGNVTTVLLTLSNPTTPPQPAASATTNNNNNNNNNSGSTTTTNNNNNGPPQLTFTVALVPADASKVKYQNGVVAEKVAEAANGVGNLAQTITPGATFGPIVLYIDQNQQGLPKKATTKWGDGGWGNWGNSWGNGWNNGWGNNGYNNGWNGGASNNNNNNNNNNGGWGANNNNNNNNNNGGGWGSNNNNNNNNNNGGGWGSSNNNNNNNNNGGGWGTNNNNNNNNNGGK